MKLSVSLLLLLCLKETSTKCKIFSKGMDHFPFRICLARMARKYEDNFENLENGKKKNKLHDFGDLKIDLSPKKWQEYLLLNVPIESNQTFFRAFLPRCDEMMRRFPHNLSNTYCPFSRETSMLQGSIPKNSVLATPLRNPGTSSE